MRRVARRRTSPRAAWTTTACALLVLLTATGCGPFPVPEKADQAYVVVRLQSDGGGTGEFMIGGYLRSTAELASAGRRLTVLFSGPYSARSEVMENGAGYPYVKIFAQHLYAKGDHPQVAVNFGPAFAVLASLGITTTDVELHAPGVPATATWNVATDARNGTWSWSALTPLQPPSGQVLLHPDPSHAYGVLAATAAATLLLLLGLGLLLVRRTKQGLVLGALALCAGSWGFIAAGPPAMDNLTVSGRVADSHHGLLLTLAYLDLPVLLGALALCVLAASRLWGQPLPWPLGPQHQDPIARTD